MDGKTCQDINECLLNPGICQGGGECVNTDGSFTCNCPPGLTLDSTKTKCLDLREETCYLEYRSGLCSKPIDVIFSPFFLLFSIVFKCDLQTVTQTVN